VPEVTPATAPAPVRPGLAARLLTALRGVTRHPGRAALIVGLLVLIAGTGWYVGVFLYAQSELNAARREVRRGHNGAALRHLLFCNSVLPDHPQTLLLSARVARRSGNFNEADLLLDRCWEIHGDDEELVLERLLLRATRGEVEVIVPLLERHWADGDSTAELTA
jgi:hypothetical protein